MFGVVFGKYPFGVWRQIRPFGLDGSVAFIGLRGWVRKGGESWLAVTSRSEVALGGGWGWLLAESRKACAYRMAAAALVGGGAGIKA